ncbi:MAG: hypothetical protein JNK15_06910 [Planctomycetes bacterium]|nr:hypothetical protein [Planctomycetota bacterium]
MTHTLALLSGLSFAIACSGSLSAQAFGTACGGQGGVPTISVQPDLRPGSSSTVTIAHLPPARPALLWLGSSNVAWGAVPLPLALAPLGMPNCELSVRPEVGLLFSTGTGTAASPFYVPLDPSLAAQRLYWQVMFEQPGLNPASTGWTRALETRIAPLPTPVTMVSSITQYGITFQFAAPVPAGQFVNGDWFVVGPVTLTGMTPPCVTVNGRVMNGAMVDPDASTRAHGYDKALYGPGNEALYSDALNVALNLSPAQPRVLQADQSLVKVVSNTNTAYVPQIETCAVLTVLATPPPQGSFRPPYSGTDHTVRYDAQSIDWSRLLNLTPATGLPDIAAMQAQLTRCWLDHSPGWPSRYLHPVLNMPDYGRDFASLYNEASLLCHTAITPAEKQALTLKLVQIGIDFYGNVQNGCYWEGVGGHGSGRKWPILFTGALLHDAGMLAVGANYPSVRQLDGSYTIHFGEDGQTFYVQQTSATQVNWGYGGYDGADIGTPEFGFSHVHWPQSDAEGWTANSYRRCCTANAWIGAVLGARMMGLVDEWNHPALFDYTDRYAQIEPVGWTRSWAPWVGRMWDLYRPSY